MIALSGPNEKAIRAQVVESVSLIAELDFPERWPSLMDVRQQSCHHSFTFIPIPMIANRPIPQRRQLQHQPWRSGNCTFNLPLMAFPSPLRRVLVYHQTGPLKVPRSLLPALPADY